jgi:hypothetical protein
MDLENSLAKLQEHIKKLKMQCDKRKQLVDLLKQSQLFYDAQNKDVLTVLNVTIQIEAFCLGNIHHNELGVLF